MGDIYKVCIIGVGYVGEHLVEVFSRGYNVVGYDVSEHRIKSLIAKDIYKEKVKFTSNPDDEEIKDCNVYLISVPTLVREDKSINNTYLEEACTFVKSKVSCSDIVVLESTISIGTTRELLWPLVKDGVYIGFSPERVDPGRKDVQSYSIPKIISGVDEESLCKVKDVYSKVYDTIVPVTSCETAELCKLYENCFRMINIAYINEIADTCQRHNIDINEMIKACNTKPFGFMPFYPSLGVGGSCIPVNPYYLFHNCDLPLLDFATRQSNMRPSRKAQEFINIHWEKNKKFLFLGVGFKPGQGLTLYSPAVQFLDSLCEILKCKASDIHIYDPLVEKVHSSNTYTLLDDQIWTSKILDDRYDVICLLMVHPTIDMGVIDELTHCKVIDYRYG